jgi:small subunit ribosomal protein S16
MLDSGETAVAVRIRMKQMGRAHRHYYRIVAIDHRQPRDGRVIEELGVYDPHVVDKEARVKLRPSRIKYWQSVGAKASDQCQVIFNRFMKKWEELESQEATKVAEEAAKAKAIAVAEATAPLG